MTGLKNIIRSMKGNRSLYSSLLLQTVIMSYLLTISAEIFPSHKDPPLSNEKLQINRNKVTTYDECKKYLCKYGYLDCVCRDHLMRKKRQLLEGRAPTEYGVEPDSADSTSKRDNILSQETNSSKSVCTAQDFTLAVKSFQKNYRLEVTGRCDERTTLYMSQRRCGQPDTVIDKLEDEVIDDKASTRKTRSLSDILSQNIQLSDSIERRKQQLQQHLREIDNERTTPEERGKNKRRQKRSRIYMTAGSGEVLQKERISWRLMSDHLSHSIAPSKQRSILWQAFRYWSEVAPRCFYEDRYSRQRVDIEIGFLEGVHLSCYRQFDGYGGEIAHKFYRDVHFDNSEPYTVEVTADDLRISLLLVAVHELGHVLGLNHSSVSKSVMNAIYHQSLKGAFELNDHDREEIRRTYGPCKGKIDVAADIVYTKPGTRNFRVYNTYFFRTDHFWLYQNGNHRPRFGDPLKIVQRLGEWSGLPEYLDAFLHYHEYSDVTETYTDEYLFFKGDKYYSFDYNGRKVIATGLIRSKFRPYNWTSERIPNNLDAAFHDYRPKVKLVYFFKGSKVYSYNYRLSGSHWCCANETSIRELYPPATQSDLYSPSGNTYINGVDNVYLSNYYKKMFFIKGNDVWVNDHFTTSTNGTNSMKYVQEWHIKWPFLCDGECS